jgi:hypothetical protein
MNAVILALAVLAQSPFIMPPQTNTCSAGSISGSALSVSGVATVTGQFVANGGMQLNGWLSTPVASVNYVAASAVSIAAANGASQFIGLAANTGVTVTLSGFAAGDTVLITVFQGTAGTGTITHWRGDGGSSTVLFPGGNIPTITATANAIDHFSCTCLCAAGSICPVTGSATLAAGTYSCVPAQNQGVTS